MDTKHFPHTLIPFVWQYLRDKKGCLAGFVTVALVDAIEMSLSPYLLKVIVDTVVQYAHNQGKILTAIALPALFYASLSIVLNLNWRF